MAETCSTGTPTREAEWAARKTGVERLSKDQVSAMAHELDADVEELPSRDLGDAGAPRPWPGAAYARCGREGRMASTAVTAAIGCDEHGRRHVLGASFAEAEPCDSWPSLPRPVGARGAGGVRPVTSTGAVMCERDEERAESRHLSEGGTAGPSEDGPEPSPPGEERGREPLLVARQATEASLALADRMEAA